MYTYGQPRTGNDVYAFFINKLFGTNAFRSTYWISIITSEVDANLDRWRRHPRRWPVRIIRMLYVWNLKLIYSHSVPRIRPPGFRHHGSFYIKSASKLYWNFFVGIEYWQNTDSPSPATVRKCASDGEDPSCLDSIAYAPINNATHAHGIVSLSRRLFGWIVGV